MFSHGSDISKKFPETSPVYESATFSDSLDLLDIRSLSESIRHASRNSLFIPKRSSRAAEPCPEEARLDEARTCCEALFGALCGLCGEHVMKLNIQLAKQKSLATLRPSEKIKTEIRVVERKLGDAGVWSFVSGRARRLKCECARLHDELADAEEAKKIREKLKSVLDDFNFLVLRFEGGWHHARCYSLENLADEWQFAETLFGDNPAFFHGFLEGNTQLISRVRSLLKVTPLEPGNTF